MTMMRSCCLKTLYVLLLAATTATAFVLPTKPFAHPNVISESPVVETSSSAVVAPVSAAIMTMAITSLPVLAVIEDDDYEYGAVDAPIGLAWGAGVLAILTALLPIALRGGEDAFNEMRERDKDTFGSGRGALDSKKK